MIKFQSTRSQKASSYKYECGYSSSVQWLSRRAPELIASHKEKKCVHTIYNMSLFEGLGSIEAWLQTAGYEITSTRFYEPTDLPKVEEIDLFVVMGGPMSVNDENDYHWLVDEKEFIKSVIESGKPILGICLGAQLIANAMGGKVFKNAVKEIGWFPVQAAIPLNNDVFNFPEKQWPFTGMEKHLVCHRRRFKL